MSGIFGRSLYGSKVPASVRIKAKLRYIVWKELGLRPLLEEEKRQLRFRAMLVLYATFLLMWTWFSL
jgi:hypothetical protein